MSTPAGLTPSQTVGPFLAIVLPWEDGPEVVADGTAGAVVLRGRLTDGAGEPVPDGLVETWQADASGAFDESFRGFGRCPTDAAGEWWLRTVVPGPVLGADGAPQAPHIDVSVFARGMLDRLVTRIYFADQAGLNDADPVLQAVPADRRERLLATQTQDGELRFDIVLQGERETPFFEL